MPVSAMCLEVMGVMMDDTRDSNGGERFLQMNLIHLYNPLEYARFLRSFFHSNSVSYSTLYENVYIYCLCFYV